MRTYAKELQDKGITIIRGLIPKELCDNTAKHFTQFCALNNILDKPPCRVVNYHMESTNSLEIATNPVVREVLDLALKGPSVVYTSLTFMYSSQQRIHRDVPHFYTYPYHSFYGVWNALEDATEENGALEYYEKGHLIEAPNPIDLFKNRYG